MKLFAKTLVFVGLVLGLSAPTVSRFAFATEAMQMWQNVTDEKWDKMPAKKKASLEKQWSKLSDAVKEKYKRMAESRDAGKTSHTEGTKVTVLGEHTCRTCPPRATNLDKNLENATTVKGNEGGSTAGTANEVH